MGDKKRPRDTATYYDIMQMCNHARVEKALLSTGPFFTERILAPRLTHTRRGLSGVVSDPSRSCSYMTPVQMRRRYRRHGLLTLPQLVEAEALQQLYRGVECVEGRTVVAQRVYSSTDGSDANLQSARVMTPVTDIVFDMEEEFAVVSQWRRFCVYGVDKWMGSLRFSTADDGASPLVTVQPQGSSNVGFSVSAVQFLSSSLEVVVGYRRFSNVDIFDLENVDEGTSEPEQRFNLAEVPGNNGVEEYSTGFAADLMPIGEHVSVAALSSGISVWLDTRAQKPEICTGAFTRHYSIGSDSRHIGRRDPLTAIAFMCRNSPVNMLLGTDTGALQLWDVRCSREYVALHRAPDAINRIHPTNFFPLRSMVYLNTSNGCVQAVNIGNTDMELFAQCTGNNTFHATATFHLPTPRLCFMESAAMLACTHTDSRSLLLYDVNSLIKQPSSMHTWSSARGSVSSEKDEFCGVIDEVFDESERGDLDKHEPAFTGVDGGVRDIPVLNCLASEHGSTVTACTVWSKENLLVCGDECGGIRLL
uniref:Uncharacterized protein TCIL3000_11_11090 n=1 Tax=Trypanosoma congolense (strain IL3000) TaxID=1068625 RepID=G0V1V3_TRYCI|nr:unnamed protein product [Trypanosoma congolense IL3000]